MRFSTQRLAVLGLTLAAAATAHAQSNFQPGYFISQTGDTVRGTINFREWTQSPKEVAFRDAAGTARTLTPTAVRGFSVSGEQYEGAVMQVDGSPYKIGDLSSSPAFQMRQDTAFVQTLISGPKSLYLYKDRDDKAHFFIKRNGALELLIYKQYLQTAGGRTTVASNKGYIGQLQLYLADCATIANTLRSAAYTAKSLQAAFGAYSACTNASLTFEQKPVSKSRVKFGVVAGVGITNLTIKEYTPLRPTDQTFKYPSSTAPVAGLYADIFLPRRLNRLSIYTELLYTSFKTKLHNEYPIDVNYNRKEDFSFDYRYLKLNPMLRYHFPVGTDFGLFANAGVAVGYALKSESVWQTTSRPFSFAPEVTNTQTYIENPDVVELGYIGGLGLRFKRLSAEARYEANKGMSSALYRKTSIQRVTFLAGFRF